MIGFILNVFTWFCVGVGAVFVGACIYNLYKTLKWVDWDER